MKKCFQWTLKQATRVAENNYAIRTADLEVRTFENVKVLGCAVFADEVAETLKRLADNDPAGYRLTRRYIRSVVETKKAWKDGRLIGAVYQESTAAGRLPWPPNRYAAMLVRAAIRIRCIVGFGLPNSARLELMELRRELRSMKMLQCHPKYFPHQLSQIAERSGSIGRRSRRLGDKAAMT